MVWLELRVWHGAWQGLEEQLKQRDAELARAVAQERERERKQREREELEREREAKERKARIQVRPRAPHLSCGLVSRRSV